MSQKQKPTAGAADRIRARLASTLAPDLTPAAPLSPDAEAAALEHFLGKNDPLVAGRSVQALPIGQIAPDLHPEQRQPRLLPLPEELAGPNLPPIYREIAAELRLLGQSLRERQIQPILVYPAQSAEFPAARYIILVGQRRWTAAALVGLEMLDAIVVDAPAPLDRVRLQYRENEHREDFSDMERAWALVQLRAALGGDAIPMDEVASQLGIKRARAYQLRRLLMLNPEQQQKAALLRLQETQLRTLLDALHREQIKSEQVDSILERLTAIAADRAHQAALVADQAAAAQTVNLRQQGIDAPTVARLVARMLEPSLGAGVEPPPALPTDQRYTQLRADLTRATTGLTRALGWVRTLEPQDQDDLQRYLLQMRSSLEQALMLLSSPTGFAESEAQQ